MCLWMYYEFFDIGMMGLVWWKFEVELDCFFDLFVKYGDEKYCFVLCDSVCDIVLEVFGFLWWKWLYVV